MSPTAGGMKNGENLRRLAHSKIRTAADSSLKDRFSTVDPGNAYEDDIGNSPSGSGDCMSPSRFYTTGVRGVIGAGAGNHSKLLSRDSITKNVAEFS